MIIIEYCASGKAISDFALKPFIELLTLLEDGGMVQVSTANVVTAVKLAVLKGQLDYKEIQFWFEDKIISLNEYGCLDDWPDGFADTEVNMCEEILMISIENRKENRRKRNGSISKDLV